MTELYTEVTRHALERMNNLDIWLLLMHGTGDPELRLGDLPSWAIDWEAQPGSSWHRYSFKHFYDRDDLYPRSTWSYGENEPLFAVYYHESDNVLVLRGTKFGVIHSMAQHTWGLRVDAITSDGKVSVASKMLQWLRFLGLEDTEQASVQPLLGRAFGD